jgi:hypothetical protein
MSLVAARPSGRGVGRSSARGSLLPTGDDLAVVRQVVQREVEHLAGNKRAY